jgi:glycosyltransferase involved in cell wall biosynthesis
VTAATNGASRPRWRDFVTEAIRLPDRFLPWVAPATLRGALALRGQEPDLVFSTSPPPSVHLVGRALAGLFGAPHVVDFRDPWLGNAFRKYPAPLFERIDAALEERVVRDATRVVLNTPALERRFRERHPRARTLTITNGFDPEAFEGLPPPRGGGSPGFVEIAHFGQLYGTRSGRFLLEALARLARSAPDVVARVKVRFFGSIDGEAAFLARARELGVGDAIASDGALPHRDALARQRRSDVLLLLGPENREPEVQVPGKLYEYLAAQRPILALSRRGGAIAEILERAGVACERAEPDSPDEIAEAIAREVARAGAPAASDEAAASRALDLFRYDRLAERLVACFEDVWRDSGRFAAAGS